MLKTHAFVLMYIKYIKVIYSLKPEVLSEFKKKFKIINIIFEKCKNILENPNFEHNHYSRTAEGIYKIGHDPKSLMTWLADYDENHENLNLFHLMASVLSCLNEISYG